MSIKVKNTEEVSITIPDWVRDNGILIPTVECVDGFSMSVQGGDHSHSTPRNFDGPYTNMEVGFPSSKEDELMPYIGKNSIDPTDSVYGWVPVEIILKVIAKHGGINNTDNVQFDA